MGQGRVHVERVPEHPHVDHKAQRPQLVFLAFAVALPDLAPLAVEDRPGHAVSPPKGDQNRIFARSVDGLAGGADAFHRVGNIEEISMSNGPGQGGTTQNIRAGYVRSKAG
jgi:hypothetical protein